MAGVTASAMAARKATLTATRNRLPHWVAPTWRAVSWTPLAAATVSLAAVAGVARFGTTQVPAELVVVACGAIVAAIAFALDDAAHTVVQPLPASARRRLAHRLALLVPVAASAGGLLVVVGRLVFDDAPPPLPPLAAPVALLGVVVATKVWWSRRRPDHAAEAGAAVAIGWPVAGTLLPPGLVPEAITNAWIIHPWPVLAVAIPLIVIGAGGMTS